MRVHIYLAVTIIDLLLFQSLAFANPWKALVEKKLTEFNKQVAELLRKEESPALYHLIENIQLRLNETLNIPPHQKSREKVLEGVYILKTSLHTVIAETHFLPLPLVPDPTRLDSEITALVTPSKGLIKNAPTNLEEAFVHLEQSLLELPPDIPSLTAEALKICPFLLAERNLDWVYSKMHDDLQSGKEVDQDRFLRLAHVYFEKMPAIRDWKFATECKKIPKYIAMPLGIHHRSDLIESIPFLQSTEYLNAVIQKSIASGSRPEQTQALIENSSNYLPTSLSAGVYSAYFFPARSLAADRLMHRSHFTSTEKKRAEFERLARAQLLEVLAPRIHELDPGDFDSILKSEWANNKSKKSLLADTLNLQFLNDETLKEKLLSDSKSRSELHRIAEYLFEHRGQLGALELSRTLTSFTRECDERMGIWIGMVLN